MTPEPVPCPKSDPVTGDPCVRPGDHDEHLVPGLVRCSNPRHPEAGEPVVDDPLWRAIQEQAEEGRR